jgi:hypothetical protein
VIAFTPVNSFLYTISDFAYRSRLTKYGILNPLVSKMEKTSGIPIRERCTKMGKAHFDFSGEHALITGASKGLGREIALHFATAGCGIAATGRDEGDLASLSREIEALGVPCNIKTAELASEEQTLEMVKFFLKTQSPIDILINNAGTTYLADLVDQDFEQ